MNKYFSLLEAKRIGDKIGVDWLAIDPQEFRLGMDYEYEDGINKESTTITGQEAEMIGRIVFMRLKESPNYYMRHAKVNSEPEFKRGSSDW